MYHFQIWNEKEYNIIINRVNNSHVGPMYMEKPYINGLHLFWNSFEWFCLQISTDAKYFLLSCPRHCDQELIVVIVFYFQIWNEKNISLSLEELLAVTWLQCILRYQIYI